jgi:hypothetical protein
MSMLPLSLVVSRLGVSLPLCSGFGQAIAVRFVEEGAKVILLSRGDCDATLALIGTIEGLSVPVEEVRGAVAHASPAVVVVVEVVVVVVCFCCPLVGGTCFHFFSFSLYIGLIP